MARKYLVLFLTFLIFACSDIFSTRDPEDPTSDGDVYIAESISELITNFKSSLLSLDKTIYELLLIDPVATGKSYSFISSAEDIPEPNIFNDWDIDNEKTFISGIKNAGSTFSDIDLTLDGNHDESLDSLEITLDYSMIFTDSVQTTIKGSFTFEVIKVDGHFWYINKWSDRYYDLSIGEKSFSKLKQPYIY
ncbi:MAG: hypothetical protein KAS62_12700 [Candidatus Delongbacteria bacterium]|nr:hypothetical protein [Candidatus Delongbacteria bacterium]